MKPFFSLLLLLGVAVACTKPVAKSSLTQAKPTGTNNLVLVRNSGGSPGDPDDGDDGESDEIIFQGSNNLFELIGVNAPSFNAYHDVIIVQGSDNSIKMYNTSLPEVREKFNLDKKGNSKKRKTKEGVVLVMVGNNQKYVVDSKNLVTLRSPKPKTETVTMNATLSSLLLFMDIKNDREAKPHPNPLTSSQESDSKSYTLTMKTKEFDEEELKEDFVQREEEEVTIAYFRGMVKVKYAFAYFSEKIRSGDEKYYYEMAELYQYGIGTEISTPKAVDLYEYAAVKKHLLSIRRLGDIHHHGTFDYPKDLAKARYYYRIGSQLGDEYCTDALKSL